MAIERRYGHCDVCGRRSVNAGGTSLLALGQINIMLPSERTATICKQCRKRENKAWALRRQAMR